MSQFGNVVGTLRTIPMKLLYRALTVLFLLGLTSLHAAEPALSEIMPSNARILADEDGDFPDWIEIKNPGLEELKLAGYFLTDDPARLTKWSFPSTTVPAGGYLTIFASGKNRTANPALLHTSFSLAADGGYLAIVKPDGTTVVSAFNYPAVAEDVAYGIAESVTTIPFTHQSVSRVLVPTSAPALPGAWNQISFTPDVNWLTAAAPLAVGFDTNRATGSPVNVATSGTAAQSTVNSTFTANLAINNNLGDFTHTLGTDPEPFWQVTLTNEMSIFSIVLFNRTSCCGSRLRDITIEILSTNSSGFVTNFTSPLLNAENAGFTYPNGPASISNNLVTLAGGPVSGRIVRVRRTPDADFSGSGGQGNADEASVLSLGEVVINASAATGLRPFFSTDLESPMLGVNASAFIRTPFNVAETPETLALKVRYDDGFVAYLNGVEVARRNAPGGLAWNSEASANRNFASATTEETINVSSSIAALIDGENVLAVQLLNVAATNADVLFQAELSGSKTVVTPNIYFTDATPGAANTTGFYIAEVADTRLSVDRGFFEAPFSLSITSATPDAVIYYSINGAEPGPGKGTLYTGPITITNTTVLRTRAFKDGWKPTDIDTATYLFLADVIYQAPNWPATRTPPPNFPTNWGRNTVDYGMDPNVVNNYTAAQWKEALTQIPSLSIVTEMANLFDPTTGIYANADGHGEVWERPFSLELLDATNAVPGRFQENGGLRIRGGASRGSGFVKHSFRFFFRREYGAGKLRYPLFGDDGAQEFESIDLRTSQNYSWPRNDNSQNDTMVREVWCRETLGAMGQPYRRSRYYHLYLNGQYWGLYETDERPDASYGETYFGGDKDNFDVIKCGNRSVTPNFSTEATDGNLIAWSNLWVMCQMMRTNASNENYFRPQGRNPDGTRNPELPVLIEVDNLIDYMLGIFYSGDGDAPLSSFLSNNQANNWFAMRDRTNPDVGFRFFNNDAEHTLGSPNSQVDRTGPFGGSNEGIFIWSNPQWFHEQLMRNPEYRVRFGDHVQKHFFNNGALTLENNTNRFIAKAVQITKAVRAYSARWGDAVREPPYGENDWTNAIQQVLNWFVPRANLVLTQLRTDNLFPSVSAPNFSQLGGTVPDGYPLTLDHTNTAGVIYFTIDGTDPRSLGGAVNPAAQAYGTAIEITGPTYVRARVLNGTNWSPMVEGLLSPPQDLSKLQLTEIMYNPPGAGLVDGDEFEFLEFKNTGTTTLNLSGLRFTSGITYQFPVGTSLAAGQFFVLARNGAQFTNKYPGIQVRGLYTGRLDNAGEGLRLASPFGGTILSLTYNDRAPWPVSADGSGFSVVPVHPDANLDANEGRNWRNSTFLGGSPGADDPAPVIATVLVNEVLTASVHPQLDTIELYNPGSAPVNVGGWFLSDNPDQPRKYRIADGTTIAAGGYLVFTEAQFDADPLATNSFSLRAEGDQLYLFSADAAGNLTGFSHGFNYGASDPGATFGRYVLSTGEEDLPAQIASSLGATNLGPKIGPVVINEIQYHPEFGGDEFIELRNITSGAVAMFDPAVPTNTWRVNGIGFSFPLNTTLAANSFAIVTRAQPDAFRARYSVPTEVPIFGPYSGDLQDSGERIELQKPGAPDTNGPLAYITVDAVRYNDKAPWPPAADGSGPSLQRKSSAAYGNDPINWEGALATPGAIFSAGQPPVIVSHPSSLVAVATFNATFTVSATGPGPIFYQWRRNGANIPGANASTYTIQNLQPTQAGLYTVLVFNSAGSVESDAAELSVKLPPNITAHPASRAVYIKPDPKAANLPNGTNVTFTVAATSGNSGLAYQWRFNGVDIPGATGTSLTVSNVQLESEGDYTCAVTDSIATVISSPARLVPWISPVIVQRPVDQVVAAGGDVSFSIEVTGNPMPFAFSWRRSLGSVVVNTNSGNYRSNFVTLNTSSSFLTLTNGILASNYVMRVVIYNDANRAPGATATFNVLVLADTDQDGIPDTIENNLGLDPNDIADAFGDLDGDGMSNRAEFIAGTDPTNSLSYLKIEQSVTPGAASVEIGAVSNRTYTVQFTDALDSGAWNRLQDLAGRPTNSLWTVTDPAWTTNRYYRVVTPRQP
jgi:hypothetical protein